MKKIVLPVILLTFLGSSSCYIPDNKLRGSGNVIEELREVFPFEYIEIDGVIDVILIPGEREEIRVEADDNLQPYIHVFNTGNKLVIDTEDKNDFKFTKNNVYITFKKISEIKQKGVGSLRSEGPINTKSLKLVSDGVGSADIEVNCERLIAKLSGVGSLKLYGKAVNAELKNSGVGSVNAYNLETEFADVENSGVGSTEVYATSEISINSNGVGSVKYRGEAVVRNINSSGIGSVRKIN